MDMKKILLSMILLALCLIQASADNYFYKIRLYNNNGQLEEWSNYIEVSFDDKNKVYVNGLCDLIAGTPVKDGKKEYTSQVSFFLLFKQSYEEDVDLQRALNIC